MSIDFPSPIRCAGALLACLAALGGCSDGASTPPVSTLERIQHSRVVRIGFANEAPFAYMDGQSGRLTGEAPEIARAVLARLGIDRVEGVLTEFGALIPGLVAGRFDVIAAGMYILPERCRQIAFSRPTYRVGEGFLQRSGEAARSRGYAQVAADPSVKLGVVVGAVQAGYAARAGVDPSRVVVFPDVVSAVEGLQAGRVDLYAATALTLNHVLAKLPDGGVEKVAGFRQPSFGGHAALGYGAFGFRQQDQRLRRAFDRELAALIGTPAHARLVAPFGFTQDELPGKASVAGLCRPDDDAAASPPEKPGHVAAVS